ncbi:Ketimine reductase mu-crystallin [Sparassis crispa]|uniref:Ketimine reductase mu-crystallin n=1 Tax=Sparassis crispa TaxID=139825 RepID=A0A401GUD2_9APHY|nr:Ketimine reductase mu-crystallin [Sparassis crispa]GBE85831.1 Ketimine reductase mu-crystallin [Sparassis crispa]
MSLLVLSASDVARVTSRFHPDDLVDLMAQVFHSLSQSHKWTSSGISQPHRVALPMENHTSLFMPSRMASVGTTIKVVSVPTSAAPQAVKERGLPASTLVLDENSGRVKAIVNAGRLTALRNASGSLLSARLLNSPASPPQVLLTVGAGAQISAHVSLFLSSYPTIHKCILINRSLSSRFSALSLALREKFPNVEFEVGILPSVPNATAESQQREVVDMEKAVKNANIIITATGSTTPFFPSAYVSPGTHLCLIGSYTPAMHEIDSDLVKRAGRVVVDSRDACLSEAGELISAGLGPSDLVELGELVNYTQSSERGAATITRSWVPLDEKIDAVRKSGDITIFKSVGVGIQDVAIACAVVALAEKEDIGVLVPDYDETDGTIPL